MTSLEEDSPCYDVIQGPFNPFNSTRISEHAENTLGTIRGHILNHIERRLHLDYFQQALLEDRIKKFKKGLHHSKFILTGVVNH